MFRALQLIVTEFMKFANIASLGHIKLETIAPRALCNFRTFRFDKGDSSELSRAESSFLFLVFLSLTLARWF